MRGVHSAGKTKAEAEESSVKDRVYNALWHRGIWARNLAQRAGILGPLGPFLLRLAPLLIRPPSNDVEIVLPEEIRIVVPAGYPSARSLAVGSYEPDVTRLLRGIIKEGMAVVDLGANIGYYTFLASPIVGDSGRVYSFEPDARSFAYLRRSIAANRCHNVAEVEMAVSDQTGSGAFVPDKHGAEAWLSAIHPPCASSVEVQTITLDEFFAREGWPSVDLIKMDIEGSEKAALDGMKELSHRNPRMQLIMEFNFKALVRAGATPESLAITLYELGFHKGYIIERGLRPFSVADGFPRSRATYNLLLEKDETPE